MEINNDIELTISFRGEKINIPLHHDTTVINIKDKILATVDSALQMTATDIKLLYKGKVLNDDETDNLYDIITAPLMKTNKRKKTITLIAMGLSPTEKADCDTSFDDGVRKTRIRDDLSDTGKIEALRRKRTYQRTAQASLARSVKNDSSSSQPHGFGRIETLPNLPEEHRARAILTELANDVGVLACMKKHGWHVGCLAELYPDGNVGQSAVCVMGLNQNKGQKILLRVRTDDLKGFRKMLSIRKVLFHELAHNVHSDHDDNFFCLMRQIEKECNELNWKNGIGSSTGGGSGTTVYDASDNFNNGVAAFQGGHGRLGGDSSDAKSGASLRELTARAAMMRLTAEEDEIRRHCGCGGTTNKKK